MAKGKQSGCWCGKGGTVVEYRSWHTTKQDGSIVCTQTVTHKMTGSVHFNELRYDQRGYRWFDSVGTEEDGRWTYEQREDRWYR